MRPLSEHAIRTLDAVRVRLPIEAPLRHSYAVHTAFERTLLRLETASGFVGWGESAADPLSFLNLRERLVGRTPYELETFRMRIGQANYTSRNPTVMTAVEMACLDLQGKIASVPLAELLGGRLVDSVPYAGYVFYRYATADRAAVWEPADVAAHAQDLVDRFGFSTIKLKGGVDAPAHDELTIRELRGRLGTDVELRLDPNASWTVETALRVVRRLQADGVDLEYLEDPTWGIDAMARIRQASDVPLATNMCVTEFTQMPEAIAKRPVDVILSDPWYWGGLHNTRVLSSMAWTHGFGLGMHSGLELGIGLAAMTHVAATLPNLTHAVDTHHHHLTDDILVPGQITFEHGRLAVPTGAGLGVEVDPERISKYTVEAAGGGAPDPYDNDWFPRYPGW